MPFMATCQGGKLMQRVMICGGPGSGKSTLARVIGERLDLPVFHMDHIHHLPNWEPRPMVEKHAMAHEIEAKPAWVFEGGMSSTYESRAARADTLIWLDLSVGLRFWRVNKRLFQNYGMTRPDMAAGCVETVGAHTWEFYLWIFRTRKTSRAKLDDLVVRHAHRLNVFHLRSPRAVAGFIDGLDRLT